MSIFPIKKTFSPRDVAPHRRFSVAAMCQVQLARLAGLQLR